MMEVKLLINRANYQIAARLEKGMEGSRITILDEQILRIVQEHGIAVPKGFDPEGSLYIHPGHRLFVKAFEEHFYEHGLKQRGFYWIDEKDYRGGFNASQNLANHVLRCH